MPVADRCRNSHQRKIDFIIRQFWDSRFETFHFMRKIGFRQLEKQILVSLRQFGGVEAHIFAPTLIARKFACLCLRES